MFKQTNNACDTISSLAFQSVPVKCDTDFCVSQMTATEIFRKITFSRFRFCEDIIYVYVIYLSVSTVCFVTNNLSVCGKKQDQSAIFNFFGAAHKYLITLK